MEQVPLSAEAFAAGEGSPLPGLEVQYASPETVDVAFTVPIGRQTFSGTATGRPSAPRATIVK